MPRPCNYVNKDDYPIVEKSKAANRIGERCGKLTVVGPIKANARWLVFDGIGHRTMDTATLNKYKKAAIADGTFTAAPTK